MTKGLRLLLLLLLLTAPALWPASPAARAQAEAAGDAEEGAATVEERRAALASLKESAGRLRQAGSPVEAARALTRAGRLQFRLSAPREAMDSYREALALLADAPDPSAEADALNGLGEAHARLGECVEAEGRLRRAGELSRQAGYVGGRTRALLTLSGCQNYGDHPLALATAREALALSEAAGDRRGVAAALSAAGQYHLAQNDVAEAERHYAASLDIWRALGSAEGQADALIGLGFTEYRKGAWQNVLPFLTQAQGLIDERAEPYKMGQINAGLAEAYIESGSPEPGLEKYALALDYYRRAQSPRAAAVMHWGIGRAQHLLGRQAQALDSLREARAGAEAIGEKTVVAMCDEYVGRAYMAGGEPEAALRHLRAALALYERVSNPMEVGRVRALVGQAYVREGRLEEARAQYLAALEKFRALSDRLNESATLYALGRLEMTRDDLGAAEEHLRRSLELTEGVRRVSTSRDLAAAFSATVHDRYEAYVECLMRRHAADPSRRLDALAFESSETSRARALSELLRATGTSLVPGLDPQLAERERTLRQSLRVREDERVALLAREYERAALDALDAELARLGAEYRRVEGEIRARHPSYGQLARADGWDLRRIQREVIADDETVLLEYALGAERGYVWAVTREGLTSHELPARATIERAAERVYTLLSSRPPAGGERQRAAAQELDDASRELSRMVLSPVADALGGRARVVVVTDGALDYVPFQLLPEPDAAGEPLVAAREVAYAPSASVLGQLREEAARRPSPPKTLAAFGDPVFAADYALRKGAAGGGVETAALGRAESQGWRSALRGGGGDGPTRGIEVRGDKLDPATAEALRFAWLELANLREVAGGAGDDGALVAADFEATRERLQSTDLSQFAVLHFATHGLLDPRRPENSGLMLSTVDREGRERGGFVGLRDIYGLRAPVELVVLSACRTALGKEVRGEGLIGLTRGFMYAGASSVVSSLWKVDDEATSELMRRFYSNMLEGGMTPAAALRAAQNSIRREPQWRSPYYWAAFTLQGEHRRALRPARAPALSLQAKAALSGVALLLLTLAACAAWRFRRTRPQG
ncbi:MAG TPA: CHAT domain-containing tetratricopeptide repeat protein [Pyrinomonadaceae bacterium]